MLHHCPALADKPTSGTRRSRLGRIPCRLCFSAGSRLTNCNADVCSKQAADFNVLTARRRHNAMQYDLLPQ
jgi:hypothetical protein